MMEEVDIIEKKIEIANDEADLNMNQDTEKNKSNQLKNQINELKQEIK
jgi:hypothetical protein